MNPPSNAQGPDERMPSSKVRKSLRGASIALPLVVLLVGLFQIWRTGLWLNLGIAYLSLLVFSGLLARFMWQRAHDREAKFGATRVSPHEAPDVKDTLDRVSIAVAGIFVLVALFLPYAPH